MAEEKRVWASSEVIFGFAATFPEINPVIFVTHGASLELVQQGDRSYSFRAAQFMIKNEKGILPARIQDLGYDMVQRSSRVEALLVPDHIGSKIASIRIIDARALQIADDCAGGQ